MIQQTAASRSLRWTLWGARAAWLGLAALSVGLWAWSSIQFLKEPVLPAAVVTDPTIFTLEDLEVLRGMGLPEFLATLPVFFFLLLGVVYFALAGWIFWRRSDQWVALLVSFVLVFLGAIIFGYAFDVVTRDFEPWVPVLNALLVVGITSVACLLYIFPDGRFVPPWTVFLPVPAGIVLLLTYLPLPGAARDAAGIVAVLGILGTGGYATVHRYRHFSSPVQRQQTKWVGIGLVGVMVGMFLWFLIAAFPPDQPGPGRVYFLLSVLPVGAIIGLLLPAAVAIAILRNRLWDVDVLLNRTVVYGPLTGILMGLFAGSIRLSQTLFVHFTGEQSNMSFLLSTLVLTGAFWPLRLRLQAVADKYLKDTPDPTKGLRALEEQMRSVAALTNVGQLTRRLLDETVAAFHAESGAIVLEGGDRQRLVQTAGAWSGSAQVSVPLEHDGLRVGELSLGQKHRGQAYTPQDRETLQRIVGTATPALAVSLRVRG